MEVHKDGVAYVQQHGENNTSSLNNNTKDGNCSKSQDAAINLVSSLNDARYVNLYWLICKVNS